MERIQVPQSQNPKRHSVSGQIQNIGNTEEQNWLHLGLTSPLEQIEQEIQEEQHFDNDADQEPQPHMDMQNQIFNEEAQTGIQMISSNPNKTQPIPKQIIREIGQEAKKSKNAAKKSKNQQLTQNQNIKFLSSGFLGDLMQNGKVNKDQDNQTAEPIKSRRSSQGRQQKVKQAGVNSKRSGSHNARNANEKLSQELIASLQSIKQDEVRQNYYNNPVSDEFKT